MRANGRSTTTRSTPSTLMTLLNLNVLSFWPAKGGEDKVWNYKICVESQRIESIPDIQSREMIFYDCSARNTRIAMEIIAIENFRIDNEKETRFPIFRALERCQ